MAEETSAAGADCALHPSVRSRLKREFAFAVKSHAELTPMSRTRSGKIRATGGPVGDAGPVTSAKKARRETRGGAVDSDTKAAAFPFLVEDGLSSPAARASGGPVLPEKAQANGASVARAVGGEDRVEAAVAMVEMPCIVLALKAASATAVGRSKEAVAGASVKEKSASRDVAARKIDSLEDKMTEVPSKEDFGSGAATTGLCDCPDELIAHVPTEEKVASETEAMKEGMRTQEQSAMETDVSVYVNDDLRVSGDEDDEKFIRIYTRSSFQNRGNRMDEQLPAEVMPSAATHISMSIGAGDTEGSELKFEDDMMTETLSTVPVIESPDVETQPANQKLIPVPEVAEPPIQSKDGLQPESAIVTLDIVAGEKVDKGVTVEKPPRRFTRSLLKTKEEPPPDAPAVLSTVTSSDGSDGSEEVSGKVQGGDGASGPLRAAPKRKMELKMSKKIALKKLPTNVRGLLGTGLLEGLPVRYVSSRKQQGVLHGVIKDTMIICSCSSCKGVKAVSAYVFELHAGSTNKHPSDFIFLENGSSIHDVLRACTSSPLDMLESTILNAVHSETNNRSSTCERCNALFQTSRIGKLSSICDACLVEKLTPMRQNQAYFANKKPSSLSLKKTRSAKSASALIPSESGSKSASSLKKSNHGRMTRKDLWLHKLVFMDDILPDGTEVAYYARGQRLLEGYIKDSGIFCSCCSSVVSPSQFEAHAGWATRRKPYLNIYTSNGVSLHELSVSLSKEKKVSRESDDLCRICADGGDLLLCDTCPRAFHKECVGLLSIPRGDWYCPCCQSMHERENYVKHNYNAIAAGRVEGVDAIEAIMKRCIRIIQSPDLDASSCVLCKCHDFSKSGFGPRTVLLCDQCEKEFHIGCLKDHGMADLKELPKGLWFCCSDCCRIHSSLQELLLSGPWQLSDHLLDTIKRKRLEKGLTEESALDVRWRLLNGKMTSPDCRLLLSKAASIFHENFDPIIDLTTKQDLIPAMVYGREVRDQDFGGMYCAVLTVNSSVVSAGIIRVLGSDAAELPLVATSLESHGHGCFQSLFSCMVAMLNSLEVKRLVLPATKEAEAIWIKKFGFSEITQTQLEEYTKGSRPMIFQGTPILHKLVSTSHDTNDERINEAIVGHV